MHDADDAVILADLPRATQALAAAFRDLLPLWAEVWNNPSRPRRSDRVRCPMDGALTTVGELLASVETPNGRFPQTVLLNEGWLLRLFLTAAERGIECL